MIYREDAESWINVSNILHILDTTSTSIDFIISSEETGYRHLYYVKAALNWITPEADEEVFRKIRLQPQILDKVPLTSGDWSVSYQPIKVDTSRNLVFFHGFKDTSLESHAYVVGLDRPCHIRRLTESNYSHSCDFFEVIE